MDLFCPYCEAHTENQVRPWQTAAGERGAVSVFCAECANLTILPLKEGYRLEFAEAKNG